MDPRGRRRGGLGAPVLGHRERGRGARGDRALPRGRARRRRGLLHDPHRAAGAAARRPLRRARPARDRLLGLPRPRPPAVQHVPRLRRCTTASRNLGPIAYGTLAAPDARHGRAVRVADGPVRLRQVHGRPPGRRPAARPRPPRRGARRRRRAPEPVLRPRLLARGPRRERAPARLGVGPAQPQRRDHVRGGRVPLQGAARRRPRPHGQALRRGLRARRRSRSASAAT